MLLNDGQIEHIGDPAETGREYLKLNFEGDAVSSDEIAEGQSEGARLLSCRIESPSGEELTTLERGEEIRLCAELELERDVSALHVGFVIVNADGLGLFEFGKLVTSEEDGGPLTAGRRIKVTATVQNALAAGRHFVHCGVQSNGGISIYVHNVLSFVIFGAQHYQGILSPEYEIEAVVEEGDTR
jgi:hypothetical protein